MWLEPPQPARPSAAVRERVARHASRPGLRRLRRVRLRNSTRPNRPHVEARSARAEVPVATIPAGIAVVELLVVIEMLKVCAVEKVTGGVELVLQEA